MELIWKEQVYSPVIQIYPEKFEPYAELAYFIQLRAGKPVEKLTLEEAEPFMDEWAALGQHPEFPFIPRLSQ